MLHDPNQTTLFPKLPEEALQQMQQHGREIELAEGEVLFSQGDTNYGFHVVLEGEIQITKLVGNETKLLAIHHRGEFMGEISMLNQSASIASAQAIIPSRVLRLEVEAFRQILIERSPVADTLLAAMVGRTLDVEAQLRQQEKLAALGKMSAGLAHELNNPAAAAKRAANTLRDRFTSLQPLAMQLNQHCLTAEQLNMLAEVQKQAFTYATNAPKLDPLTQSDKEDEVTNWLEMHDVDKSWQIAPTFVSAGIDTHKLDTIADNLGAGIGDALTWLEATLATSGLIDEIEQSASRISELVKAVKGYTYMDRAPLQEVDIHEGLDNTLLMLCHKLKKGVTVTRKYDRTLPRINAYANELNQVWTNLIDNAIDAMNGKGQLTILTAKENNCILVEVADSGVGIPAAIQSRIFEPFFTTKGVGEGTGLGLEIAYRIVVTRHHGDIHFESKPGDTRFRVRLPIVQPDI
ncbi:ATP-binding protein [Aliterella atlantica]|uniref:histidine kinase n=1 Tax=Aliterella atlantica CENA595 TaxID=1618023 RepID=A0A0D8ZL76_9CYAN|nr:ATP-binding protein [Aliterella atlantica]KJH69485.1 histidine kinase [Aliterella atlantica CENA595]